MFHSKCYYFTESGQFSKYPNFSPVKIKYNNRPFLQIIPTHLANANNMTDRAKYISHDVIH